MSTEFIGVEIWPRLRRIARKCRLPAEVAVAYFAKGAAKALTFREASRSVVDASEFTIKKGLTCPAHLLKLQKRGIRNLSVTNLHAKAFIFGGQAFIGSSNASRHSANGLVERPVSSFYLGPTAILDCLAIALGVVTVLGGRWGFFIADPQLTSLVAMMPRDRADWLEDFPRPPPSLSFDRS